MTINRRDLLVTGAAFAAAPLFPIPALAAADLGDAAPLRGRVADFAKLLSPQESEAARFPFGGQVQQRWNFMGAGGFIKPGLRLEQMSEAQKSAAWDILSAALSPRGLEKARDVMSLQQVLIEMGSSPNARSPERYSFAIFGEPASDQTWALRLEGHHLSLTFTVANDRLTGVTPSSFSVNPNRVGGGLRSGLVTLKREDDLARRLAADLTGPAKDRAFFMQAIPSAMSARWPGGNSRLKRAKACLPPTSPRRSATCSPRSSTPTLPSIWPRRLRRLSRSD